MVKVHCVERTGRVGGTDSVEGTDMCRPVTRGGVQGDRCTPLSSERGVQ